MWRSGSSCRRAIPPEAAQTKPRPNTGSKNRRLRASMPRAQEPTGKARGRCRLTCPVQGPKARAHKPAKQPAKAPITPTALAARPVAFEGGRTASSAHRAAVAANMPMAVIKRNMTAGIPTPGRLSAAFQSRRWFLPGLLQGLPWAPSQAFRGPE